MFAYACFNGVKDKIEPLFALMLFKSYFKDIMLFRRNIFYCSWCQKMNTLAFLRKYYISIDMWDGTSFSRGFGQTIHFPLVKEIKPVFDVPYQNKTK